MYSEILFGTISVSLSALDRCRKTTISASEVELTRADGTFLDAAMADEFEVMACWYLQL